MQVRGGENAMSDASSVACGPAKNSHNDEDTLLIHLRVVPSPVRANNLGWNKGTTWTCGKTQIETFETPCWCSFGTFMSRTSTNSSKTAAELQQLISR